MAPPIRVLELRSVRGTGGGPEKTILLGATKADPARFAITSCYLRDARDPVFGIHTRARALGVDYVEIVERHSFDPSIWPRLRRLVRERRIDIVHAHEYKTDLLALLLARREDVIPLATVHGWSGRSHRERLYYFFDRRLLERFPLVIAVSEPIRQTLVKSGASPERVRRVRNGIDFRTFTRDEGIRQTLRSRLSIGTDVVVVGCVARLEAEKRLDLLLEAVVRLPERVQPLVVIAGEGSCRQQLEELAARYGLSARLLLLGHRDDAYHVHQVFDVYVQTSDTEGIPNAVLEAMSLETPIVATDVGGTRDLIDHDVHALLVPPRDPEALARAIEQTLADSQATTRRVAAARARVERELSFDTRTKTVEAIYEELVEMREQGQHRGALQWA